MLTHTVDITPVVLNKSTVGRRSNWFFGACVRYSSGFISGETADIVDDEVLALSKRHR